MRSIFLGSILFIQTDTQYLRGADTALLSNMQNFPGPGTGYTQHYAEISGNRLGLYKALRKYSCRVDTAYTQHYAVFSGVDTADTKQYAVF